MDENNKRRRGRPVNFNSKRNRINVRLSDKEFGWAHQIAESHGVSVNEAIRMMVDYYFRNVF